MGFVSGLESGEHGVESVGGEEGGCEIFEGREAIGEEGDADEKLDQRGDVVGVAWFEGPEKGLESREEIWCRGENLVRDECDVRFSDFKSDSECIAGDGVHWEEVYCKGGEFGRWCRRLVENFGPEVKSVLKQVDSRGRLRLDGGTDQRKHHRMVFGGRRL